MPEEDDEAPVDMKMLIVLYTSVFVGLVGFGIMIPLLPYLAISLGASEVTLGAMTTVYSLMQLLGNMVLGVISDRVGAKQVLCFCLLGSGMSYVAFGLTDSLNVLLVLRGISGFCSGTVGCTQAFLMKCVPEKDRVVYLGYVGACLGAGFACGPGLGAGCLALMGFQGPCFVAGGICIASFLGGMLFLKEPVVKKDCLLENGSGADSSKEEAPGMQWNLQTLQLFGSTALYYVAFSAFEGMGALYFKDVFDLSASKFGALCTLSGIGACLLQMFGMKKLTILMGVKTSGIVAHICRSVAYFAVALDHSPWVPYAQGILIAGGSCLSPATAAMLSGLSSAECRGLVLGMNQTFAAFGRVLGPMGAAFIYQVRPDGMWYAAGLCSLVGALLFWAVPMPQPDTAKQPKSVRTVSGGSSSTKRSSPSARDLNQLCMDMRDIPLNVVAPELFDDEQVLHGDKGSLFEAMYGHSAYVGDGRQSTGLRTDLIRHSTI